MLGVAYCRAACVSVHKHSCSSGVAVFNVVPSTIVFVEGVGENRKFVLV